MAKLNASQLDFGESLDAALFDAFTKRLMTPITDFPAFKLGLININGDIKKQPKSREEKRALSFLDRLAIMFKRYLVARNFQIYTEYRLARLNPVFLRAIARAMGLRFTAYYDLKTNWEFPLLIEDKKKKNKTKQLNEENERILKEKKKKEKELQEQLEDFLLDIEENVEEN